jgi:hypothetical protein
MRYSIIRSRENASVAGDKSSFHGPRNRTKSRFNVRRILGKDDLWITEYVLTHDGQPSYVVSIMEFRGGQVAHETQYFGDAFEPGPSRAQWVEPIR